MDMCVRCKEVGEDRRTLRMSCGYAMQELNVPFIEHRGLAEAPFIYYSLFVCKDCRASWMAAIEHWFNNVESHDSTGTGVFVRRNGATVELTEQEVEDRLSLGIPTYRVRG